MVSRLAGRVAVVTGGGSGIGRAAALAMAAEGAAVAIADVDMARAQEVATLVDASGGRAAAFAVDVADPKQMASAIAGAVAQFGGIDVLLNNAAILTPEFRSRDTDVVDMELEVWERTMQVNLRGPMLGCKYAIPEMRKRGKGSIIMISSTAATAGDRVRCAYGVSKGGVNSLVKYVATAFGHDGIRCNAIAPGVVVGPSVLALYDTDRLAAWEAQHVTPRLGKPEDIASAVVFLASDESEFITGEVMVVDGGLSCHSPGYAATASVRSNGR